ncbi:MAG: metallophosphoesterase [Sphingomonas sp.]
MAAVAGLAAAAVLTATFGFFEARARPIVRRATVILPDWPRGAPPVTVAFVADIHMESAAMNRPRLQRIVDQVNALRPDLIVLAGDFIQGDGADEARRALPLLAPPLSALHAPLGTIAVLGNHDHWTDPPAVAAMLRRIGATVLDNQAVRRGPLAIGGVDDPYTHHDEAVPTLAAMRRLGGAEVMIAHSPDEAHGLPPDVHLLLAGHTHCGQIVLPLIGAPVSVADPRYRCGLIRDPGRAVIVTAGVGTSQLPMRLGAPPDLWLMRLGGPAGSARQVAFGRNLDDRVDLHRGAER